MIKKAQSIATLAHKDQKRKFTNEQYIVHPERVSKNVTTVDQKIVAWLHDVVEDTSVTLEDLRKEGFEEHILQAIDCLTRRENENYLEFVKRVMKNELAIVVKLSDLKDNLSDLKSGTMRDKYLLAQFVLENQ